MKVILVFIPCILAGLRTEPSSDELKYIRTQVTPDVFPYVAVIPHQNRFGIKSACAGTILNANWVLTTAVCVHHMDGDLSRNRLIVFAYASSSTQPLSGFKQKRQVVEMIGHPRHIEGTLMFNHGVLKVREAFIFDENFGRVKFYSVDLKTAQRKMYEMMFEFRQRRCEDCEQPDFGKYDCKMVSWKMENYSAPHLRLMEVTLLGYDECDKITSELLVSQPSRISVSICVQPRRVDLLSPKGLEQLTPPEFYEGADNGAPLICSESGTEKYNIWGTLSQVIYTSVNGSVGQVAYVYFATIESVLFGYKLDDPYGRGR